MSSYAAAWVRLAQNDHLKRSSLCVTAIGSKLFVFGGELKPRLPRDNDVHQIELLKHDNGSRISRTPATSDSPSPRVGAASTALNGKLYMFSGRGGEAMAPIDEAGSLWAFDPASSKWALVEPASHKTPMPRSYHCIANDGQDTIYLHAGCPEKGRLSDFWSFTVSSGEWKELASAPDPARGGSSIAFANGKVYRMNGFDGNTEQGGSLDVYEPASNAWRSISFLPDGETGPGARSVSALVPVNVNGDVVLVTLFGESDPSSLGHQGAGKMLSDVWAYSLGEENWKRVQSDAAASPQARGWFDADCVNLDGKDYVVVVGGLGESNERLNDAWLLSLS